MFGDELQWREHAPKERKAAIDECAVTAIAPFVDGNRKAAESLYSTAWLEQASAINIALMRELAGDPSAQATGLDGLVEEQVGQLRGQTAEALAQEGITPTSIADVFAKSFAAAAHHANTLQFGCDRHKVASRASIEYHRGEIARHERSVPKDLENDLETAKQWFDAAVLVAAAKPLLTAEAARQHAGSALGR